MDPRIIKTLATVIERTKTKPLENFEKLSGNIGRAEFYAAILGPTEEEYILIDTTCDPKIMSWEEFAKYGREQVEKNFGTLNNETGYHTRNLIKPKSTLVN